jgi:hypothetical protein
MDPLEFLGFHDAQKPIPSSSSSSSSLGSPKSSQVESHVRSVCHRQSWGLSVIKKNNYQTMTSEAKSKYHTLESYNTPKDTSPKP